MPLHYVPRRHSSDRFHAQKGGPSATERDEFLRAAWRMMVAQEVDPERLVFLRRRWERTHLPGAPLRLLSKRRERVHLQVGCTQSWQEHDALLASITLLGGMGQTMAVEGSTNQEVFEAYIESTS